MRKAFDASPDHLFLIILARDDTTEFPPGQRLSCGRTDRAALGRYLERRHVLRGFSHHKAILDRAAGNWLIARLLADAVLSDPMLDLDRLPETIGDAYGDTYTLLLDQTGAADEWQTRFRPVVGPLAVAGSGPALPFALLVHASAALGGPAIAAPRGSARRTRRPPRPHHTPRPRHDRGTGQPVPPHLGRVPTRTSGGVRGLRDRRPWEHSGLGPGHRGSGPGLRPQSRRPPPPLRLPSRSGPLVERSATWTEPSRACEIASRTSPGVKSR